MKIFTYDVEVFNSDWLVVFKDHETGEYTVVHNDNDTLREFITDDCVYVGVNSKPYDQYIVEAIVCGCTPQEVKAVNDFIIAGNQGWKHSLIRGTYYAFNNVDIRDDMQIGLSLKAIEGHLGLSVKESSVPFDIDRLLTDAELKETIEYCKFDVDTTEKIIELRKDYLKTKIDIGRMAGIPDTKAMGMTNAKLTAALLGATRQEHNDERKYVYPDCLKREHIPQEVFEFFDKMYDPAVSDKELFGGKLQIKVGNCPVTLGYGGIHGAIPNYMWKEAAQ